MLYKLGKHDEAEREFRAVLKARCELLGENDPDTLASRSNLATVLSKLGESGSGGAVLLGGVEVLLLVAWLQRVGVLCAALTVAVLVFGSHSVLHFTVK